LGSETRRTDYAGLRPSRERFDAARRHDGHRGGNYGGDDTRSGSRLCPGVASRCHDATRDATRAWGKNSVELTHKRVTTNGVTLHYVTAGRGPVVLCMHGWPQNHREFVPVIARLADSYTFIAPDLHGYADSDKPFDGYEPKNIAQDMLGVLEAEGVQRFHILSHDLGGPPSVALAYVASNRALSLATIETPFFGLSAPGYVDPRVTYWHLGMHMNMDVTRFLIEGREEQYLRHFFRDFAYNPDGMKTKSSSMSCSCANREIFAAA
jgi:hypothetical protein